MRAAMMARMAQAAQGGEPVRDLSPLSRANQKVPPSKHFKIGTHALHVPARHFPQLKAVSVNKMPPNAPLDGAKPTGEPTVASEPVAAPTHTPAPTDPGSSSAVPVKREANEPNAPPGSLRWSRGMPIPRTYEVILDAFIAVQQVHQFMRRRGKGGNTEELCAGVEEVTKRRCTLDTLRAIEAFRPGTMSLSVRPGANDDDGRAASDPTRVRVDFPDVNNGIKGGAKGVATNDAFRQILVDAVAERHAKFLRDLPNNEGDSWEPECNSKGVAIEWHEGFDLEAVPYPPLSLVSRSSLENSREDPVDDRMSSGNDEKRRKTDATATTRPNVSGNGTALAHMNWHATVAGGDERTLDTQDVKLKSVMERAVTAAEAEAERTRLGHVDAATLPISAVAEVMHRRAVAELEEDPATVEQRRQRRLRDMLPTLFDCVRSNMSTGKRKRVMPFQELLGLIMTHTTRQNVSEEEMEGGLRLLAESAPEWVELRVSQFSEEREELWRVKNVGKEVTQFVREKLEAMKQDRL